MKSKTKKPESDLVLMYSPAKGWYAGRDKTPKLESGTAVPLGTQAVTFLREEEAGKQATGTYTFYYRRPIWQDLLKDARKVGDELLNLLITMKEFLLGKPGSFSQSLVSETASTSSANGSTVKLAPVSYDQTNVLEKRKGSSAYTNMTFSGGSPVKKRVRHRSSIKKVGRKHGKSR